jgi:hypothetical protein
VKKYLHPVWNHTQVQQQRHFISPMSMELLSLCCLCDGIVAIVIVLHSNQSCQTHSSSLITCNLDMQPSTLKQLHRMQQAYHVLILLDYRSACCMPMSSCSSSLLQKTLVASEHIYCDMLSVGVLLEPPSLPLQPLGVAPVTDWTATKPPSL